MIRRFLVSVVVACVATMGATPAVAADLVAERTAIQFPDPQPNPRFDDPFDDEPTPERSRNFGVRVILSDAKDRDRIELYDLEGGVSRAFELSRAVTDVFGVLRSRSHYEPPDLSSYDMAPEDHAVSIDGRLMSRQGDDWAFNTDLEKLVDVAKMYDFAGVELAVCPPNVPFDNRSTRQADDLDSDGCMLYRQTVATASGAPTISIVATPDKTDLQVLLGIIGATAIALSVVTFVLARLLQRSALPTLSVSNLIVALVFLAVSIVAGGIGMIVFGTLTNPITDFVLAQDLGSGASFLLRASIALLVAIPFFVPAVVLMTSKPAVPQVAQPQNFYAMPAPSFGAGPGVPSWLGSATPPPQQPWTVPSPPPMPQPWTQQPPEVEQPQEPETPSPQAPSEPPREDKSTGWNPPA